MEGEAVAATEAVFAVHQIGLDGSAECNEGMDLNSETVALIRYDSLDA